MATQGNIAIWNFTKLISKFPEIQTNDNLQTIIGGYLYENPFQKGKKVLVTYEGDNLHFPNGFYPIYEPSEWLQNFTQLELTEEQENKAEDVLSFLLNECQVADWQVWN